MVFLEFTVSMSLGYNIIGGAMKSLVVKRSVVLAGHKTSVSLEDAFWESLKKIAARRHLTLSALLAAIDSGRNHGNLSSAIRLFVLAFYRDQIGDQIEGMRKAHEAAAVIANDRPAHGYT